MIQPNLVKIRIMRIRQNAHLLIWLTITPAPLFSVIDPVLGGIFKKNTAKKSLATDVSDRTKHALIICEKNSNSSVNKALKRINRLFGNDFMSCELVEVSTQTFLHTF
jgi:hypothetical protein